MMVLSVCLSSVIFICGVVSEKNINKKCLVLHLLHKAIQIKKHTLNQTVIARVKMTRHSRMLVSGIQ